VQVDDLAPARLHIDLVNRETWRSGRAGAEGQTRRPLPVDRVEVLGLLKAASKDRKLHGPEDVKGWKEPVDQAQVEREATELFAIIQAAQVPPRYDLPRYDQWNSEEAKGKLDHIVRELQRADKLAERDVRRESGVAGYPFSEYLPAQSEQLAPIFHINWVGIPLTLLGWALGFWLIRRSKIGVPGGTRPFLLGRFLTYFWSQPSSAQSQPHPQGSGAELVDGAKGDSRQGDQAGFRPLLHGPPAPADYRLTTWRSAVALLLVIGGGVFCLFAGNVLLEGALDRHPLTLTDGLPILMASLTIGGMLIALGLRTAQRGRARSILSGLALVGLLAGMFALFLTLKPPSEPSYQDKPVRYWSKEISGYIDSGDREAKTPAPAILADRSVRAVPMLIALLKDSKQQVRLLACLALKDIGPNARSAMPALEKAAQDPDHYVRAAALEALMKIDPEFKPGQGEQPW
jgi:hypothetical protein